MRVEIVSADEAGKFESRINTMLGWIEAQEDDEGNAGVVINITPLEDEETFFAMIVWEMM